MRAYYVLTSSGGPVTSDYVEWIVENTIFEDKEEAEELCKKYNEQIKTEKLKKQFIGMTFEEFEDKFLKDKFTKAELETEDYRLNENLYQDIVYNAYHEAEIVEVNFKSKTK
jgi:hypothetical protein